MRKCNKCKEEKEYSEFHRRGKNGYQIYCKPCKKEMHRVRYLNDPSVKERLREKNKIGVEENRQAVWDYLKLHPCIDCGEGDPTVLEFDHRDPAEKSRTVCDMARARFSWDKIEAEIAKCDVRCANCHRRRTAKQFGYNATVKK